MREDELSPEQRRDAEAFHAELDAQVKRVGVDLRAAMQDLHEVTAPVRSDVAGEGDSETYMMTFTIDLSGFLETLRELPDAAGTKAFIAAYNAINPDWRNGPATER